MTSVLRGLSSVHKNECTLSDLAVSEFSLVLLTQGRLLTFSEVRSSLRVVAESAESTALRKALVSPRIPT